MADASSDHVEMEKAYYMIAREKKYLSYLDKAIKMIQDGTFGICVSCKSKIQKERLQEVLIQENVLIVKQKTVEIFILINFVVLLDQFSKILIKNYWQANNLNAGIDNIPIIGDYLRFVFIENAGHLE